MTVAGANAMVIADSWPRPVNAVSQQRVVDQLPDRGRQVCPGIEQAGEHAVVFTAVMRRQGRAERQAVDFEPGLGELIPAELSAQPGELASELLVGSC